MNRVTLLLLFLMLFISYQQNTFAQKSSDSCLSLLIGFENYFGIKGPDKIFQNLFLGNVNNNSLELQNGFSPRFALSYPLIPAKSNIFIETSLGFFSGYSGDTILNSSDFRNFKSKAIGIPIVIGINYTLLKTDWLGLSIEGKIGKEYLRSYLKVFDSQEKISKGSITPLTYSIQLWFHFLNLPSLVKVYGYQIGYSKIGEHHFATIGLLRPIPLIKVR